MKLIGLILLFLLYTVQTYASGVGFEGQVGSPNVQIENQDGTSAHYSGLSLLGKLKLPIWEGKSGSGVLFTGSARYLDVSNNANSGTQREAANNIGAGAGLELHFYRLFVGFDAYALKGRHYMIGTVNRYLEYDMSLTNFYGGLRIDITKGLGVSFSYSTGTGSIPKSKTFLTEDSPYNDTVMWFHLIYNTNQGSGKFLKVLFN